MRHLLIAFLTLNLCVSSASGPLAADDTPPTYDPSATPVAGGREPLELAVQDAARSREVLLCVYLPSSSEPAPVVLFSHGLGGNRHGSAYLGKHWSARGIVVVCLQHPGSDDGVWKDAAAGERLTAMKRAGNLQNSLLRFGDVPAVINQLTEWNAQPGHALHQRLDLTRIGMSGHSYGAVTTQAVSGQSTPQGRQPFLEPRIKAAIAFSPTGATGRQDPAGAFGAVKVPWLLMTGTQDTVDLFGQTAESRLSVFPALPPGGKYELVLDGAQHSAFTDRPLPGEGEARNPRHHQSILAISTAFWDAHLRGDAAARAWLDGDGPRKVLDAADRWQIK